MPSVVLYKGPSLEPWVVWADDPRGSSGEQKKTQAANSSAAAGNNDMSQTQEEWFNTNKEKRKSFRGSSRNAAAAATESRVVPSTSVAFHQPEIAESYVRTQLGVSPVNEDILFRELAKVVRRGLPEGWSEHVDDQQRVYYWNSFTGESVWLHPDQEIYTSIVDLYRQAVHQRQRRVFLRRELRRIGTEAAAEMEKWTGPYEAEGGEQFWYNASEGRSEWLNPRFELARRFMTKTQIVNALLEHSERDWDFSTNGLAATVIQRFVRGWLGRRYIVQMKARRRRHEVCGYRRRVQLSLRLQRRLAAQKIQRAWREFREVVVFEKAQKDERIAGEIRRWRLRQRDAVRVIQRMYRRYRIKARRKQIMLQQEIARNLQKEQERKKAAAVSIQAHTRGYLTRSQLRNEKINNESIQFAKDSEKRRRKRLRAINNVIAAWRRHRRRVENEVIRSCWMGEMRRIYSDFTREQAACSIQKFWRGIRARHQRHLLATHRRAAQHHAKREAAANKIRSLYLRNKKRRQGVLLRQLMKQRQEVTAMQRDLEKSILKRRMDDRDQRELEELEGYTIRIQSFVRGRACRQRLHRQRLHRQRVTAATILQAAFRGHRIRKRGLKAERARIMLYGDKKRKKKTRRVDNETEPMPMARGGDSSGSRPSSGSRLPRFAGPSLISSYAEDAIARHISALNALTQQQPEDLGVHAGERRERYAEQGKVLPSIASQVAQELGVHPGESKLQLISSGSSPALKRAERHLERLPNVGQDPNRTSRFRMNIARQLGLPQNIMDLGQNQHEMVDDPADVSRQLSRNAQGISAPNLHAHAPLQQEQRPAAALRQDQWLMEFQSLAAAHQQQHILEHAAAQQQQLSLPGGETMPGTPTRRHQLRSENARLGTSGRPLSGGSEATERAGAKGSHAAMPGVNQFPALTGHPDHHRRAFPAALSPLR